MPRPRTHIQQNQIRTPMTQADWARLMTAVIERAAQTNSPLLSGLRQALATGKAEAHLRRLGIIHTGDIEREFPLSKT